MKKILTFLLIVIGMITPTFVQGQSVSAGPTLLLNSTNITIGGSNADIVSAYSNGTYVNDHFYGFNGSGLKFDHEIPMLPGSDPSFYSHIYASSDVLVSVKDYQGFGSDQAFSMYKADTVSGTLDLVHSFSSGFANCLHATDTRYYASVGFTSTLSVGADQYGNGGTQVLSTNPAGNNAQYGVLAFDHNGNFLTNGAALIYDPSGLFAAVTEIKEVSAGLLVKVERDSVGVSVNNSYYVLLNPSDLSVVLAQSPVYYGDISVTEAANGNLIVSTNEHQRAFLFDSSFNLLEDNLEYPGSGSKLFYSNGLVLHTGDIIGSVVLGGGELLDARYASYISALNGNFPVATDFDGINMLASGYFMYGESPSFDLAGNTLPACPAGMTAISIISVDCSYTPSVKLEVNASGSNVTAAYNYVCRDDNDPDLLVDSDNHIAFMQFSAGFDLSSLDGTSFSESEIDLPPGYSLSFPPVWAEENGEYFAIIYVATPTFQNQTLKVIATTDELSMYVPNNPPTILGTSGGQLDLGTGLANDPTQATLVNTNDPDGDAVTLFVDPAYAGMVTITNVNANTHAMYFDVDDLTPLTFNLYADDGMGGLDSTVVTRSFDGYLTIGEFEKVSMNLFPNPATDIVNITHDAPGSVDMVIRDMNGKILHSERFSGNTQLSVSDFQSGVYIVQLSTESGAVTTTRLIKQ